MAGKLPPVVYIDPAFNDNDDHPPVHPINGQELIENVYRTLAASPQWKNILLVITYDENGGFYDHVSPPTTTDDSAPGFDQLGFRVPTMVIGPYVKENYISDTVLDHTSCLAHLINVFGLEPLTAHATAANDLTEFIDMDRLAKFDWAKPIDVPDVDPSAWPMPAVCSSATSRTAPPSHPVIDWANEHPELVAGIDLRDEIPAYRQGIRETLARLRR
jgi:phospholipase C